MINYMVNKAIPDIVRINPAIFLSVNGSPAKRIAIIAPKSGEVKAIGITLESSPVFIAL